MTCEKCGGALEVGAWPFCPHGFPKGIAVIDDTIEGGPRFFETFGDEKVWIDSKSKWKLEVDKRKDEIVFVGDNHDRAYFQRKFKQHDEWLRDTGQK